MTTMTRHGSRHPVLLLLASVMSSALALGCSGVSEPQGQGQRRASSAVQYCVYDGAACVDIPDVYVPSFDAGLALPTYDAALPSFDGALPTVPQAPCPASLPTDSGILSCDDGGLVVDVDAAIGAPVIAGNTCNLQGSAAVQKLVQELIAAEKAGSATPCSAGCGASECCFVGVACVAQ
jgi:hypothetical protein